MEVRGVAAIVLGYISGSLLFAYWIPKWLCHVDVIKESKDHNPGTFNAFQAAGILCGSIVLVLELAKGAVPVYLGRRLVAEAGMQQAILMTAPVAGHAFSCFHHGRGGKGIAVSFGVLIGLFPDFRPGLLLAFYYLLFSIAIRVREHGKRTILAFLCWSVSAFLLPFKPQVVCASIMMSGIVIAKHVTGKKRIEKVRNLFPF